MATNIILAVLAATEIVFLVWDWKTRISHLRYKAFARLGIAAVIALLMLVGVLEGFARYGALIILFTVMGFISLLTLRKKGEREMKLPARIFRAVGSGLLYTAAMLPAIMFPQFKAIAATGNYPVETVVYSWTDESRIETYAATGEKRKITVQFYYPETKGQYPLVVFSHGACATIDSNDSTCRELASHGYVVAAVAHPYHAIFVDDADGSTTIIDQEFMSLATSGPLTHTNEEMLGYYRQWMKIRTDDLNFALDTVLAKAAKREEGAFERIDSEHIGLFGHSMGGSTCEAVGRQRDDIDAVIVLEGTMLGELTGCEGDAFTYNHEPYPVPLLDVNSDSVAEAAEKVYPCVGDYVNFYVAKHGVEAREVTFHDAAHMNFCDMPLVSPPIASMFGVGKRDARECIGTVNDLVLSYFDSYLKDVSPLEIADEY